MTQKTHKFFSPNFKQVIFLFLSFFFVYFIVPLFFIAFKVDNPPLVLFLSPFFFFLSYLFYVTKIKKKKIRLAAKEYKKGMASLKIFLQYLALAALSMLLWEGFFSLFWSFLGIEIPREQSLVEYLKQRHSWVNQGLLFVGITIMAPLAEELLFRGSLLEYLKTKMDVKGAIAITSFLFTILHLIPKQGLYNVELFCELFTLSALLSFLYVRSKGVLFPIYLHVFINTYSFIACFFA